MNRNLTALGNGVFDLLVIGGGIYGACVAWDASLRGLSVALVEKNDFGSATSANSLKTIHGGLRYLQHADFKRMRESIYERRALMRIAPHLVHPLPVIVPTYGHGLKGREVMAIALKINDLVSCDRNSLADPQKHIPAGRILPKAECLQLIPGIETEGLNGGAMFHDAQVYNSERLLLAFLRSATQIGANVANYLEVIDLLKDGNCVQGVTVRDALNEEQFDIQAKTIINTSGPWINNVLGLHPETALHPKMQFAKAMNVITRPLFENHAVGISSKAAYRDNDAILNKGSRLFFIAPWRNKSMVGTANYPYDGDPADFTITDQEIQTFLDDINQAYPPAKLTREDVSFVHGGLLPSSGLNPKTGDVQLAKHYQLHDHRSQGWQGLLSVTGVKYTTARNVAEKAVDWIFTARGQKPPPSTSAHTHLHGGQIEQFETFLQKTMKELPQLEKQSVLRLVHNYGSAYPAVLQNLEETPTEQPARGDLSVLKAEVLHGVREEMAQKLSDVVMRRLELGSTGCPDSGILRVCAETMGQELGWTRLQTQAELDNTYAYFENGMSQEMASIQARVEI